MDSEYLQKIQDLGLSEKEAKAYLSLLEIGRGSAASVAHRSGLKAPTAYVILKSLIEKGFVRRVPRAKKQLFVAEAPSVAVASAEERLEEFKSIVPKLDALTRGVDRKKTRTLFFEGFTGIQQAYNYRIDELKDMEFVAFFAIREDISDRLNNFFLEWSKTMADANVSLRAIAPDHPSLKEWRAKDEEFKREVKVVPPEKYFAKSAIEIFPDFVRIIMFGTMQCTIIEDTEFAGAYKQIFEMVWESN